MNLSQRAPQKPRLLSERLLRTCREAHCERCEIVGAVDDPDIIAVLLEAFLGALVDRLDHLDLAAWPSVTRSSARTYSVHWIP